MLYYWHNVALLKELGFPSMHDSKTFDWFVNGKRQSLTSLKEDGSLFETNEKIIAKEKNM